MKHSLSLSQNWGTATHGAFSWRADDHEVRSDDGLETFMNNNRFNSSPYRTCFSPPCSITHDPIARKSNDCTRNAGILLPEQRSEAPDRVNGTRRREL
jgi:hypothetical protein